MSPNFFNIRADTGRRGRGGQHRQNVRRHDPGRHHKGERERGLDSHDRAAVECHPLGAVCVEHAGGHAGPSGTKITSFSPDSGTVGDGITNANRLTLAGTAEADSAVKVFDGGLQIGTATANASGACSFTTAQWSNANFTATATDAAGNTSSGSSL